MRRYYLAYFTNSMTAGESVGALNQALTRANELPEDYNYIIIDRFINSPVAYRNTCTVPLDEYQEILKRITDM